MKFQKHILRFKKKLHGGTLSKKTKLMKQSTGPLQQKLNV